MTPDDHRNIVDEVMQLPLYGFMGMKLVSYEPGVASVRLEVREPTMGIGHFHGGLMPALIDAACYFAVLRLLEEDDDCSTTYTAVSLLRPVHAGDTIDVRGDVVQRGRTRAFMSTEARVGDRVVAFGHITKLVLRRPSESGLNDRRLEMT